MKLHFEPNLDSKQAAIEAVYGLFRGQEICRTEFTVTMKAPIFDGGDISGDRLSAQFTLGIGESDLGVGNRLTLLDNVREYLEIAILIVTCKETDGKTFNIVRLVELLHRAIPYPMLLLFQWEQKIMLSMGH